MADMGNGIVQTSYVNSKTRDVVEVELNFADLDKLPKSIKDPTKLNCIPGIKIISKHKLAW